MPKVHYTLPEAQPNLSYMDSVRVLHPASDDPEERRKRTQTTLDSILGPGRKNTGVGLPSGHSGINEDPIFSKYYQEKKTEGMLELHQEYQLKQRRQWEEQQRQAQEQETSRLMKLAVYEKFCEFYDTRVAKLAQFGPKLDTEINKLLEAFDNGNEVSLKQAVIVLLSEVLEPANQIFEEMKKEIMLESLGAEVLKSAWPLAGIDKVLDTFNAPNMSSFNDSYQAALGYMLQGLRAVCQPILSAVPLVNPLGDPPAQPFVAAPIPVNFETYVASAQRKQPAVPAPEDPNAGKNFRSFADLLKGKEDTSGDQPQVPNIAVTPPSVQNGGAPSGSGSPPNDNKALGMFNL